MKIKWNLELLYKNEQEIKEQEKEVIDVSNTFINKWKDRKDYLTDETILKQALDDYIFWIKNFGANAKASYYYSLKLSLDENNPTLKAKDNLTTDSALKIQNDIQFFELNLAKISTDKQKQFLSSANLAPYKHFLEKLFSLSKHLLSDSEEKIINLKSVSGYSNWVQMLSGLLSDEEDIIKNKKGKPETKNFSQILSSTNNKDKIVRDSAAKSFNTILVKHLKVAENELNSVLQDKKVNDFLKNYSTPQEARLISDDIEESVVNTMIENVKANMHLSHKYYSLKAKLFGVKKLKYHERNVEYGNININCGYEDSVKLILRVLNNLDPQFKQIFEKFINNGQIDVYPTKGKRSGAFCSHNLISHPTYILLNWNNEFRDVTTLAHELGHGINNELVKLKQNAINFGTPTSTAEVASTFFEDFVFQELLKNCDDQTRLSLLMTKAGDDVSSIFRQVAFYNFEIELHKLFRSKGYLSEKEIGDLFQKNMVSYMGPAVEQSIGSQNWWVYVSHFRYYFYVYSYASGLLISKYLQGKVKEDSGFISNVKEFLSAGLSMTPYETLLKSGVDIKNNSVWSKGLQKIDDLLNETENLARKLKKIT